MSKFNSTSKGNGMSKRTLSKDGVSAYELSPKMELCDRVLTCFYGQDRFYENGDESRGNLHNLLEQVAKEDPKFVAKLAVLAREKFNLRSVTQVLTAELSKIHRGDDLVPRVVERIAVRPDDLTELASYLINMTDSKTDLNGRVLHKSKKLPNSIKRGIARAITRFDEYQWSKYSSGKKELKLIDLLKLTHPKPKDDKQSDLWRRAIRGELKAAETWERKLTQAGQNKSSKVEVEDAKRESWEQLIMNKKLPYMAALRNLRNIIESNVSQDAHQKLANYLSNENAVANSRQLPFRFYSAYKALMESYSIDPFVRKLYIKALNKAMYESAKNITPLKGRTLIAIDLSGSMCGTLSDRSGVTYMEVGAMLGALADQYCEDSIVTVFGHDMKVLNIVNEQAVLDNVNGIMKTNVGHSTNAHLVMRYINENNIKVDNILFFTDMQLNGSYWGDSSLTKDLNTYRARVNKDAYVYEFNLAGYGSTQVDPNDNKYVHLSGWSDNLLKYVTEYQQLRNGIVDMVEQVEI
jgi:hypothetical protein